VTSLRAVLFALLLAAGVTPALGSPGVLRLYVGTYTDHPAGTGHGEGIYLVEFDPVRGRLGQPRLVARTPNPTWLAVDARHHCLYAVNEIGDFDASGSGSVSAFAIDPASGALTPLGAVSSQGASPAHLSLHPSGKFVLVANYGGGDVAVLPIGANGALGEAVDVAHLAGPLNPARAADDPPGNFANSDHAASHVHMVASDPSGRFVIANDAGLDRVFTWRIDPDSGKLSANDPPSVAMPAGSAPRHFAFHPNKKLFFDLLEQDSTLAVFDFAPDSAMLTPRQRVSTLPPGFAGSNLTSEVVVSADGRFVYAANRLRDTIATFRVAAAGGVQMIDEVPTQADYPRGMALDPTGHFLFSCNQRGDSITVFRLDSMTGRPRFTGQFVPIGSPTAIAF
jgi:6-phosphogluconolactonase (cycloisomerase 2 family)